MHFFYIGDIPVKIVGTNSNWENGVYDNYVDGRFTENLLKGNILVKVNTYNFNNHIFKFTFGDTTQLRKVTFLTQNKKQFIGFLKINHKIIRAAGGVVGKKNKILMIYRNGRWELPKGKLEPKEKSIDAAVREVGEECSVLSKIYNFICSTWYTYIERNKIFFKQIVWYNLLCVDDSNIKPQRAEGITQVKWVKLGEHTYYLNNSYKLTQYVLNKYLEQNKDISM